MRIFQLVVIAALGAYQTFTLSVSGDWAPAAVLGVALPAFGIFRAFKLRRAEDPELTKVGDFVAALVLTAQIGLALLIGVP